MVQKLPGGIYRSDLKLADGRDISYYDSSEINRSAADKRNEEAQPGIGHLRLDPLVDEWVVIASHRQHRVFLPPKELCPLCASTGEKLTEIPDKDYEVVVFGNRAPALTTPKDNFKLAQISALTTPDVDAAGACEVICYTSDHSSSFAKLTEKQIRAVLEAWKDRDSALSKLPFIEQVFIFENRGEEVGVTLSHPHGQIYAYSFLPPKIEKMLQVANDHLAKTGKVLLDEVIKREIKDEKRIIAQNSDTNDEWGTFKVHFESVHPQFFTTLSQLMPSLTPLELRQCAYIKINLSPKQVGNLLNITPDSVKKARMRIKKKLNLSPEDSLTKFIATIQEGGIYS